MFFLGKSFHYCGEGVSWVFMCSCTWYKTWLSSEFLIGKKGTKKKARREESVKTCETSPRGLWGLTAEMARGLARKHLQKPAVYRPRILPIVRMNDLECRKTMGLVHMDHTHRPTANEMMLSSYLFSAKSLLTAGSCTSVSSAVKR